MSTEIDTLAHIVAAREIKRHGLSMLDEALVEGAVHVIKNDRLTYVILSEEHYRDLLEDASVAERLRIKEALEDVRAGRVTRSTAEEIIEEFGLDR